MNNQNKPCACGSGRKLKVKELKTLCDLLARLSPSQVPDILSFLIGRLIK